MQSPLYLSTHNIHERQTAMPPVGFELVVPASERRQTYAVDDAAIGIAMKSVLTVILR